MSGRVTYDVAGLDGLRQQLVAAAEKLETGVAGTSATKGLFTESSSISVDTIYDLAEILTEIAQQMHELLLEGIEDFRKIKEAFGQWDHDQAIAATKVLPHSPTRTWEA